MNDVGIAFVALLCMTLCTINPVVAADRAADFTLTDIEGQSFSLSDYRGSVVVLDFMSTRCRPCVKGMGELKAVHERYPDVIIISIETNPSCSANTLSTFKQRYGADWVFAVDTKGVARQYRVWAIPKIVIVDGDGFIRYSPRAGATSASAISQQIEKYA